MVTKSRHYKSEDRKYDFEGVPSPILLLLPLLLVLICVMILGVANVGNSHLDWNKVVDFYKV